MVKESAALAAGSKVWVEDDAEAWTEAEVISVERDGKKKMATVRTLAGKELVVRLKNCHAKDIDAPSGGVDDMTKLSYLHEPGVMHNLAQRYTLDEIYTYTGQILIAVNPFRALPHLYNEHMMEEYKGMRLGELSPHVFAIAEAAYRAMCDYAASQSILVSGESGAGKTETTKLIMQYLAYMGGRAAEDGRTVESQVLESNPLLEAFGNAKTVRNNNSSRFGKFVEIQFDHAKRISGAAVRTYLLERSRVVQIADPERNYHCFYQLCAGATDEDKERLKLGPAETYHYLNQSQCIEIPGKSTNAEEYVNTRRAMDVVGLTEEEQDAIFSVVAAVLHLGNVTFAPGKESDSSKLSGDEAKFHLEMVAKILKVDKKQLRESLITRTIVTPEGNIKRELNPETATLTRDTLAKTIYARLFDWLVDKVNKSIGQDPNCVNIIGVLDIYGFETFKINSFEQFCINLANEKLQQHFNQHVFKSEQDEYEREEIDWSYIEFVDNQDVLELIEKKPTGIISLLDEQCMFPKSTAETFATKMYQTLASHPRFEKPKLSQTDFTVDHYAGKVTYQTDLFLDKNKDYVVMEHQALLQGSKHSFVAGLFPPSETGEKAKSKFTSLGSSFKQQLADLMSTLNTTEPHYIRCVKPNSKNQPSLFENVNVLHQLRCGGVLEAIRISCAGYPTRKTFDEFVDRFGLLAPEILASSTDEKAAASSLLDRLGLTNYQVGKTKVFLRAGQLAELDAMRADKLNSAARVIQRGVRTCLLRRRFLLMRKGAVKAQAVWRGKKARRLAEEMRRQQAAIRIQKWVRRDIARRRYVAQRKAATAIQSAARGMAARKRYNEMRRQKAAVQLQSAWRRHSAEKQYSRTRRAALKFQCAWRGRKARLELKKLKWEAKQTGALQAAKGKLEKQLEEAIWRLDLEKRLKADLEETREKQAEELQGLKGELDQARAEAERSRKSVEALKKELAQHKAAAEAAAKEAQEATARAEEAQAAAAAASAAAAAAQAEGLAAAQAAAQAPPEAVIKTVVKEVVRVVELPGPAQQNGDTESLRATVSLGSVHSSRSSAAVSSPTHPGAKMDSTPESEGDARLRELGAEKDKQLLSLQENMTQMREEYLRMEEQMRNLEQENQVLRKQALEAAASAQGPPGAAWPHASLAAAAAAHAAMASQTLVTPPTSLRVAGSPGPSPPTGDTASDASTPAPLALARMLGHSPVRVASTPAQAPLPAMLVAPATAPPATRAAAAASPAVPSPLPSDATQRRMRQILDKQAADQDAVLQFIVSDLGFDDNRPMAACLLYKALLHWRSFEAERTSVFDRVIQTIGGAIEGPDDAGTSGSSSSSSDRLAYWLTNAAGLLHLLQRSLRPGGMGAGGPGAAGAGAAGLQRRGARGAAAANATLLGRMAQISLRGSTDWQGADGLSSPSAAQGASGGAFGSTSPGPGQAGAAAEDGLALVDAKYPALLFKQQLTAYVEKLFGAIRDNLKKDITPLLQACIQTPRTSKATIGRQSRVPSAEKQRLRGTPGPPAPASPGAHAPGGLPPALNQHWAQIIQRLTELLSTLKANFVPPFLIRRLFTQVFSFINVQLFNSLLLRRECCSFSNGEYVKAGLAELEKWIMDAGEDFAGSAWDELKYIRQAVGFLVIGQKTKKSFEEITADLCPSLTMQQLYRISTMYWDDKYNTQSVSPEVISTMRARINEAAAATGHSTNFLLDDDSSIPFTVDDISRNLPNISLKALTAPPHLRSSGTFLYLFK